MENGISYGGSYADSGISLPDSPLDDYIYAVVDSYQSSARSLWRCAEYVWKLYEECGMYEKRFTETLIENIHVQRDTLYHWRKAWDLRVKLLELDPLIDFGSLTITHFYQAADFVQENGLEWVKDFLETAAVEGWSSRALAGEMRMATGSDGTLPWLMNGLGKVLHKLQELYSSSEYSGLSEDQRERLRQALRLIEDLVK